MSTGLENRSHKMRFTNFNGSTLEVRIEPLGDFVSIQNGVTIEVFFSNKLSEVLEVEFCQDYVSIVGWVESVMVVKGDGSLIPIWCLP